MKVSPDKENESKSKNANGVDSGNSKNNDDGEDHNKFFKRMQECFSSNTGINKTSDDVNSNERSMKKKCFSTYQEGVNENLRASLSDLGSYSTTQKEDNTKQPYVNNAENISNFLRDINS